MQSSKEAISELAQLSSSVSGLIGEFRIQELEGVADEVVAEIERHPLA